jgi:anti-anti-sigma factor
LKLNRKNKEGAGMELTVNHLDDKAVIVLEKKNVLGNEGAEFQNTILDLIDDGNNSIEVDLSHVEYITSWGIGMLVHAHTTCVNKEIDFHLAKVHEKIMSILKKVKLDSIFNIR